MNSLAAPAPPTSESKRRPKLVATAPVPSIVKERAAMVTRINKEKMVKNFGFSIEAFQRFEEARLKMGASALDPRLRRIADITEDEHDAIVCNPCYSQLVQLFCS